MFFLQAEPAPSGMITIAFYVLVIGIFYLFFLRPNIKRGKEQANFEDELHKGLEVVTTSGIIGRISKIEDDVIHLQLDQKTFVKMLKNSISKDLTEKYNSKGKDTA